MEKSFNSWLQTSNIEYIQRWRNEIIALGFSWHAFHGERKEGTIATLERYGIPSFDACQIYSIASEQIARSNAPMGIFWDFDAFPSVAQSEIVARIRSCASNHGRLVVFRSYTGREESSNASDEMRRDLMQYGCQVVHVDHCWTEGLAVKHLIADAMEFAYTCRKIGTVCFITCDKAVNYIAQKLKKTATKSIVITKEGNEDMFTHSDLTLTWEKVVVHSYRSLLAPPPGFHALSFPTPIARQEQKFSSITKLESKPQTSQHRIQGWHNNYVVNSPPKTTAGTRSISMLSDTDIQRLKAIIINNTHVGKSGGRGTLKSQAGGMLRQTYPEKFPNRSDVQIFLANAIDLGIVRESTLPDGRKILCISSSSPQENVYKDSVHISDNLPMEVSAIPSRVVEMTITLPFIMAVPRVNCPIGTDFPDKTFIHSSKKWIFLMYRSMDDILRVMNGRTWMKNGTIVDYRKVFQLQRTRIDSPDSQVELSSCSKCNGPCSLSDLFAVSKHATVYCRSCFLSQGLWTSEKQAAATMRVVELLEMMSENDDVYVRSSLIRKLIVEKWKDECISRGQAALWIEESVKADIACELNIKGQCSKKSKVVFLKHNLKWALAQHPDVDMKTEAEEKFISEILWKRGYCVSKIEVIKELKAAFPLMDTPLKRNKMFLNAVKNGRAFIAKGPLGQVVGLSREDAEAGLSGFFSNSTNGLETLETTKSEDSSSSSSEGSMPIGGRLLIPASFGW